MISSNQDFLDDTAWELYILAVAIPLTPLASISINVDLRQAGRIIHSAVAESGSREAVNEFRNSLMPLLFGAAWKVIDLFVELSLHLNGKAPRKNSRWAIEEKVGLVSAGVLATYLPPDVAKALAALYIGTKETRHALVHRRVRLDSAHGDLIGFDTQGTALPRLSTTEQAAFCRVAQRIAEIVSAGSNARRLADLQGQLALLTAHHGIPGLVGPTNAPLRIAYTLPQNGELDIAMLRMRGRQASTSGGSLLDLELDLPNGPTAFGELENAPDGIIRIDPQSLPPWLTIIRQTSKAPR